MRTRPGVALSRVASAMGALALALVVALALAIVWVRALPAGVTSAPLPYSGARVGGWSGIDVSANGRYAWIVTDRGRRSEGPLRRDGTGALTGIEAPQPVFLPGLRGPRIGEYPDAEGIDVGPPGSRTYVAFEGFARLRAYDPAWERARWIPNPPDGQRYHENRGFEALARDPLGRLYTLPERPLRRAEAFPLYRFTRRDWMSEADWSVATHLTFSPGWYAVGADFGPEGALYLLERRFTGLAFASRIRRFDISGAHPSETLDGDVLYDAPPGRHGNLEGLGIWRDDTGALRAVMVSDDNMRAFQRAEIVEVILGQVGVWGARAHTP
ncbi:MAG: esterase-like activity of phytase family protein [Pseudomonadota bacterium]